MDGVWRPRLLDRSMWDAWVASGSEGAYEKASQLTDEHLAEHQVLPLGDQLTETLARIVAEAGL
jgi:trimethylamine:corrinoid methyltransferase-like protein